LKLLLDTHIWLWLVGSRKHLAPNVLSELQNPSNELWLSPISVWEALTLHRKGRMFLGPDLSAWLAQATLETKQAAFTNEIMFAAVQLPLPPDPADRFIAATAQILDYTLVTADSKLLGLGTIRTMANR